MLDGGERQVQVPLGRSNIFQEQQGSQCCYRSARIEGGEYTDMGLAY